MTMLSARDVVKMEDSETVGQRLKRLRLHVGMSQRELGCPGVSYAYISRIEAGTRAPSVKALRKLAAKLQVTTSYLEFGVESRGEDDPAVRSLLRKLRRVEGERDYLARELVRKQVIIDALTDKAAGQ